MARSKGRTLRKNQLQVAGTDTKVWQSDGTATSTLGVVFSQRGEVVKAGGIKQLNVNGIRYGKTGAVFPLDRPIYAMGAFSKDGYTQLILEVFDDDTAHDMPVGGASSLLVYESGTYRALKLNGEFLRRSIPKGPRDATRFIQVGSILLILNGRDPNLKWDGVKLSPLGISHVPSPPATNQDLVHNSVGMIPTVGRESLFLAEWSIPNDEDVTQRYKYRLTWHNDQGQESEASPASAEISDLNIGKDQHYVILVSNLASEAPSDDITGRLLYRSVDGYTYYLIASLPGSRTDTYWDYTLPDAVIQTTLSPTGENNEPPISSWAFPFKGRTYYGGSPSFPLTLFYSRQNGATEAVSADNYLVMSSDLAGDEVVGGAVGGDYALVFTKRSTHMLTQDKNGVPNLTPMSQSIGAISSRSIVAFGDKVFFVGPDGLYAFDGGKITALSREISEQVAALPRAYLSDVFGWADPRNRRVYFSFVTGSSDRNNEVWAIHVDTGALTKIGVAVTSAVSMRNEVVVGYSPRTNMPYPPTAMSSLATFDGAPPGENLIGIWDAGQYLETDATISGLPAAFAYPGIFETRWLSGDNPQSDKTYYRVDVFYVQTGESGEAPSGSGITVSWSTDWRDEYYGETSFALNDPDALLWSDSETWGDVIGSAKKWDSGRTRCRTINLTVSEPSSKAPAPALVYPSGSPLTGKSLKLKFESSGINDQFKIVGFLLHYADLGVRAEGTDAPLT